jgi:hypothetical protein
MEDVCRVSAKHSSQHEKADSFAKRKVMLFDPGGSQMILSTFAHNFSPAAHCCLVLEQTKQRV